MSRFKKFFHSRRRFGRRGRRVRFVKLRRGGFRI